MSPGGGPRVKYSRSQRLDLEAAETLVTGRAENHAKGNCGGKKPRNSEDSTVHFIDKDCTAQNRASFPLASREQVLWV